jgi:hypothetical protein
VWIASCSTVPSTGAHRTCSRDSSDAFTTSCASPDALTSAVASSNQAACGGIPRPPARARSTLRAAQSGKLKRPQPASAICHTAVAVPEHRSAAGLSVGNLTRRSISRL